jgi:hypothetical protein
LRTALEIIFAVAIVVISAPFAFSLWARRGQSKPDRPGEKTVVTFQTDKPADAIMRELVRILKERGVETSEPGEEEAGWGMRATLGKDVAYILVGRMENDELAEWILHVQDPSSGGPGPASFVPHIDAAMQLLGVTDVRWQRR